MALPAASFGQVICACVLSAECSGFPRQGTVHTGRRGLCVSGAALSVVGCLAGPVLSQCQVHPRPQL